MYFSLFFQKFELIMENSILDFLDWKFEMLFNSLEKLWVFAASKGDPKLKF